MVALERKAAAAASATAAFQTAAPRSPGSDGDDGAPSPLQSTAGELRQNWRGSQDTASSPGLATQQQPPWASRRDLGSGNSPAHPPPVAPTLHSIGARAAISAEFSSSPLYALLQDPASPSGTYALAPLIALLEATPPHEPLASGCSGLDDLVNGWLADANTAATGEVVQRPARTKPAIIGVSVDPRVLRQSLFQRAVADVATRERAIAFAAQEQRGETQLMPGEVAEVRRSRACTSSLRVARSHLSPRATTDPRPAQPAAAPRAPCSGQSSTHTATSARRLSLSRPGRLAVAAPSRAARARAAAAGCAHVGAAPSAGGRPRECVGGKAHVQRGELGAVRAETRRGGRVPRRRDSPHHAAACGEASPAAPQCHAAGKWSLRRLLSSITPALPCSSHVRRPAQAEAEAGVAAPAPEELAAHAAASTSTPLATDGEGDGARDVKPAFSSSFSSAAPALAALSRVRAAVQVRQGEGSSRIRCS